MERYRSGFLFNRVVSRFQLDIISESFIVRLFSNKSGNLVNAFSRSGWLFSSNCIFLIVSLKFFIQSIFFSLFHFSVYFHCRCLVFVFSSIFFIFMIWCMLCSVSLDVSSRSSFSSSVSFSLFGCWCIFVYIPLRSVLFFNICYNLFLLLGICVMVSSLVPRKICMVYFPWFWFLVLHRTFLIFLSVLLFLCVFLLPKLVPPVLYFS